MVAGNARMKLMYLYMNGSSQRPNFMMGALRKSQLKHEDRGNTMISSNFSQIVMYSHASRL